MYLSQAIKVPFHWFKKTSLVISLRRYIKTHMEGGEKETCRDTKMVSKETGQQRVCTVRMCPLHLLSSPPHGGACSVVRMRGSELKKWPVRAENRQRASGGHWGHRPFMGTVVTTAVTVLSPHLRARDWLAPTSASQRTVFFFSS